MITYSNIVEGIFIERPNRFIAYVEIEGCLEICHVKNTGRCKELLIKGVKVYLEPATNPERKTKFSLISVEKEGAIVNIDSQVPNKVIREWLETGALFSEPTLIAQEKTFGNSRFDFYVETPEVKAFIEVKGCTLEEKGVIRFPDAPTERGVKHIKELIEARKLGYEAYIVFLIQMEKATWFEPNVKTHPAFGEVLKEAQEKGVEIICLNSYVTKDTIGVKERIPYKLV